MPHADPEERKAYEKRYREENREKLAAQKRQWYIENKDRYREYARRQRGKHKARKAASNKRYREENPGYKAEWRRRFPEKFRNEWQMRRANKKAAPKGDPQEAIAFAEILRFGCCEQCGSHGPIHIDHIIPLSTGGEHGWQNFAGLCQSCNSSKGTKSLLIGMLN